MTCSECGAYKEHNCQHQCMIIPDGKTCSDCKRFDWCSLVYDVKAEDNHCDFEPVRFVPKPMEEKA